jgi:hypothetical protein
LPPGAGDREGAHDDADFCRRGAAGAVPDAARPGAVSEFPAGGVVMFKAEPAISIAREDLEIRWDGIRVRYVFASTAGEPLERRIGFPLAKVPLDDAPDGIANISMARAGGDPHNYMAFEVAVDGKPVPTRLHEYAWLGDADVTGKLRALDVPLFAGDGPAFRSLAELPEATTSVLKQGKLVTANEPAHWLVPNWHYQAVYDWVQVFRPGDTVVEIAYKPFFGASSERAAFYPGGEGARRHCLDGATRQRLEALASAGVQPEPFTVGYILRTATNWHGPIGEFNLKLGDGPGSLFTFCVPEGLKPAGDGARWQGRDFVPRADLGILFYRHGG